MRTTSPAALLSAEEIAANAWRLNPLALAQHLEPQRYDGRPLQPYRQVVFLARIVQRAMEARGRMVIISVPPQHGKTEITSKWGVAYMMAQRPNLRVGVFAYNSGYAAKSAKFVRDAMLKHGPELGVTLEADSRRKDLWNTSAGGYMMSGGLRSGITGNALDVAIVDDPIKGAMEAMSKTVRDSVYDEFYASILTRIHPGGVCIIVMTRWHEDDLAGRLIAMGDVPKFGKPLVIRIPAIAEEHDPLGRQPGETLCEQCATTETLQRMQQIGGWVWSALWQQRPLSRGANSPINPDWIRRWGQPDMNGVTRRLPDMRNGYLVMSWDLNFGEADPAKLAKLEKRSKVAGQLWLRVGAEMYLLRAQLMDLDFVGAASALLAWYDDARAAYQGVPIKRVYVEAKANGVALITTLRTTIPGLIAVDPGNQSKMLRLAAVAGIVQAGQIYFPPEGKDPLAVGADLALDLVSYPDVDYDDGVDAFSQALHQELLGADPGNPTKPEGARALLKLLQR